jgi:phage regulator Rha-like protein
MNDIIHLDKEQNPRISTAILADWFWIEHKWMLDTIEKYSNKFLLLWEFEEWKDFLKRGLKPTIRNKKSKVLFLNEPQVNFLGTLTNNTERTVEFKLRLVMEFQKYRDILKRLLSNQNTASFVWALPEWKAIRKTLTDAIQDYNDYRKQRGLEEDKWIYSNITKLVNTQLFDFQDIEVWKWVNKRNLLSEKQRRKIADVEDDLVEIIIDNLENPYAKIKEFLESRMTHLKKSIVIDDQLRLK